MLPAPLARGIFQAAILALSGVSFCSSAQDPRAASPAAKPIPQADMSQSYAPELVEAGRIRFIAECAFCHGRDTAGGSGGSDLTRSELVAQDVDGNQIGALVRGGREDKGMPAFTGLSDADLTAIIAYIHTRQTLAASVSGGRRAVDVADLLSGDATAGRRYFESHCTGCHSAHGDLAGIAARVEGLPLLQRMLYPRFRGSGASAARPTATVTTAAGSTVSGAIAYRDEFTIAVTDADGRYRSWPASRVRYTVHDPLAAHVEQLARYTDRDMHDVLAYLHSLR